jgi:hypothetical protein
LTNTSPCSVRPQKNPGASGSGRTSICGCVAAYPGGAPGGPGGGGLAAASDVAVDAVVVGAGKSCGCGSSGVSRVGVSSGSDTSRLCVW